MTTPSLVARRAAAVVLALFAADAGAEPYSRPGRPADTGPREAPRGAPGGPSRGGAEHEIVCRPGQDERAALQAAIDATPAGGLLLVQPFGGVCQIGENATDKWLLRITRSIRIRGNGLGSALEPTSGVGPDVDLFKVEPAAGATVNFAVEHLFMGDPNTGKRFGRHGILIDTSAPGANVAGSTISDVYIARSVNGGNAVNATNVPAANPNGGFYSSTIERSVLGGGVSLNGSGDSLRIVRNTLTGPNTGVYANLVSVKGGTAGNLLVEGNNCTASAGCVVIDQALAPVVVFNEFEQTTKNEESNDALVDLRGATSAISAALVFGNQLQSAAGLGNPTLLRIGNAIGTTVDANRVATGADWTPILNTARAVGTIVGRGNLYVGNTRHIADLGANTAYPLASNAPNTFSAPQTFGAGAIVAGANGSAAFLRVRNGGNRSSYTLYSADAATNGFDGFGLLDDAAGTYKIVCLRAGGGCGVNTGKPAFAWDINGGLHASGAAVLSGGAVATYLAGAGKVPSVAASRGTATLSTGATDTNGTVTASATGVTVTLTFGNTYANARDCTLSAHGGASPPYTTTSRALVVDVSAGARTFTYQCMGS